MRAARMMATTFRMVSDFLDRQPEAPLSSRAGPPAPDGCAR